MSNDFGAEYLEREMGCQYGGTSPGDDGQICYTDVRGGIPWTVCWNPVKPISIL